MLTKFRIGSQSVGITVFKFRHFIGVCHERGLSFNPYPANVEYMVSS